MILHSFAANVKTRINAFTIVELLVVIGIISVLAVALLVTLNPAEAQRRSRDAKRVKDVNTLQVILEQLINDGVAPICTTAGVGCLSTAIATPNSQGCAAASNWLASDVCVYAKSVPADPVNAANRTCIGPAAGACTLIYRVIMNTSGDYEINARQEATANSAKLSNDGGIAAPVNQDFWFQVFSRNAGMFTSY